MFYSNLLIFNRLGSLSSRPEMTPQSAETHRRFGFGQVEFIKIADKIDSISIKPPKYSDVKSLMEKIDEYGKRLINSSVGIMNSYNGGNGVMLLYRYLADRLDLDKVKPYGENGIFFHSARDKYWPASFSAFSYNQKSDMEKLMWLADPEYMIRQFFEQNFKNERGQLKIWTNHKIEHFTKMLKYSTTNLFYLVEPKKIQNYFRLIYNRHFDGKNKRLATELKSNANHFEPLVPYAKLSDKYKNILREEDIDYFLNQRKRLGAEALRLRNDEDFDVWMQESIVKGLSRVPIGETVSSSLLMTIEKVKFSKPKQKKSTYFETIDNNLIIKKVLEESAVHDKISDSDSITRLKADLYVRLLSYIYRQLQKNPNVSDKKWKQLLKTEKEIREEYDLGIYPYGIFGKGLRKLSATTSKQLVGVSGASKNAPKLPEDSPSEIATSVDELAYLQQALVRSMDEGQLNDKAYKRYSSTLADVKRKLMEEYDIPYIIPANELLVQGQNLTSDQKDVMELINYYGNLFKGAIANAEELPKYKRRLIAISDVDPKAFTADRSDELYKNWSELRSIYYELKAINFLPSPKAYNLHKHLLITAGKKYAEWNSVLGHKEENTPTRSPYISEDANLLEENDASYVYAPFVTESEDGGVETFVYPKIMMEQLTKLGCIENLALALFPPGSKADELLDVVPLFLFTQIGGLRKRVKDYYFGRLTGSMKYDGETPFPLEEEIKKGEYFQTFLSYLKTLFEPPEEKDMGLWDRYKAGLRKQHRKDYQTPFYEYLRSRDLNPSDINKNVRKEVPFLTDIYKLLEGKSVDIKTVKKAGCAIAIFTRRFLKNYQLSRTMITELLQPHMPGSRRKVLSDEELRASLRRQAGHKARFHVSKYFLGNAGKMKEKFRDKIVEQYEKRHGKEPTPRHVEFMLNHVMAGWTRSLYKAQEEIFFDMLLDNYAIKHFRPFGKLDAVDARILKEYRLSIGTRKRYLDSYLFYLHPRELFVSDESLEAWDQLEGVATDIVFEVALVIASIYIPGVAVANMARLATMGIKAAIVVKYTKRACKALKLTKILRRVKNLKQIHKIKLYGGGTLKTVLTATGFTQVHPMLSKFFKDGKQMDTLVDEFQKYPWWRGVLRIIGESALFGAFHAVGYAARYLKYSGAGAKLLRLTANPRYGREAAEVMKIVEGVKTEKEMVRAFGKLLKHGLPIKGVKGARFEKIKSEQLKKFIRSQMSNIKHNGGSIGQLKARYTPLIENIQSQPLRKMCGFLIQDLGFDTLAMILGSIAREGIVQGKDAKVMHLFTADGLFHMYMMGFAFRMAHTGAPALKAKFAKWYKKNPMEIAVKLEAEQVKITEAKRKSFDVIDATLAKARMLFGEYSIQERSLTKDGLVNEAQILRTEIAKLKKEIAKLERNRTKVEQAADRELESVISGFEAYVKEASQTKLIKRPVRGFVETVLPGWLRTHFFKHYRKEFKMRDGTTKSLYLGSDGVSQMLLSERPGDFRYAINLIKTSERCILSPGRVIFVASRLKNSEMRTKLLETAWSKMTSGHRYGYTRLVGQINPGRAKEHQLPENFKVERKYKDPKKQEAYRYARWRAALFAVALGAAVFFGGCGSKYEQSKSVKDKIDLSEKASVTRGGGLYRSKAEHRKARVATKKDRVHVTKAKVTKAELGVATRDKKIAGSKLTGYDGIDGTPKAKVWTKKTYSNIFHKDHAVRRAVRRGMYKMLKDEKVPYHILYALKNADQLGVPRNIQQFVFNFAVLDYVEGRAIPIVTPYIMMDQHGFAKWWAKEYSKSVKDAPMLKDYLKYTELIEKSKREARLDTWWHSSFPGTFPIKPIVIFLMLFGAGRLTRIGLKKSGEEISKSAPKGRVAKVKEKAGMLFRFLSLIKMQTKETEIILPREEMPPLKDTKDVKGIIGWKKWNKLDSNGKRALDDIYERLSEGDFGMIRFPKDSARTKETAKQTSLRFFKDIINGFYDALRLQRVERELEVEVLNEQVRTNLLGEAAGLKTSVDAFELTLERKLLGRKSPFHWSQLLRPKGPRAVAKTLASILQLDAKPLNTAQKRAVEKLCTRTSTKLAKLFKEFKGMRTVLLELIKLKKKLDGLEDRYNEYRGLRDLFFEQLPDGTYRVKNQYLNESGDPIGEYASRKGEANHAKAFCDVYEGMESQHSVYWKQWRTFAMKANNILGWLNKKVRPNIVTRGALNVLITYVGYGILTWLIGDDFEKPEEGDVESGPGIPGLPIHPHEKRQDYEDLKSERIRKLLPQAPGFSQTPQTPVAKGAKPSGQSSGLPKEAINPPTFEGGAVEPKGSVKQAPGIQSKPMNASQRTAKSIQDAIDHLTKQAERKKK